jgi:hypothetical protein
LSYEFSEDLYYDFPDNSVEAEGTGTGNGNALPPTFLSVPLDLTLNEGSRLRLPCRVDRLQGFVLLWKKGANIIAIGSLVIAEVSTVIVSTENTTPRWQAYVGLSSEKEMQNIIIWLCKCISFFGSGGISS